MTLPRKNSRLITIEDNRYRWVVSGNDGWIDLIICKDQINGQRLIARFDYGLLYLTSANKEIIETSAITPTIVNRLLKML